MIKPPLSVLKLAELGDETSGGEDGSAADRNRHLKKITNIIKLVKNSVVFKNNNKTYAGVLRHQLPHASHFAVRYAASDENDEARRYHLRARLARGWGWRLCSAAQSKTAN
jgi:hypothetical protein